VSVGPERDLIRALSIFNSPKAVLIVTDPPEIVPQNELPSWVVIWTTPPAPGAALEDAAGLPEVFS
jgi:hypothetical protein